MDTLRRRCVVPVMSGGRGDENAPSLVKTKFCSPPDLNFVSLLGPAAEDDHMCIL